MSMPNTWKISKTKILLNVNVNVVEINGNDCIKERSRPSRIVNGRPGLFLKDDMVNFPRKWSFITGITIIRIKYLCLAGDIMLDCIS